MTASSSRYGVTDAAQGSNDKLATTVGLLVDAVVEKRSAFLTLKIFSSIVRVKYSSLSVTL
jgi:hypothetical protein